MLKATLDSQHQLPITSDDLLTILKENQIDFKLYEANIEPFIRFCHIQNISVDYYRIIRFET